MKTKLRSYASVAERLALMFFEKFTHPANVAHEPTPQRIPR